MQPSLAFWIQSSNGVILSGFALVSLSHSNHANVETISATKTKFIDLKQTQAYTTPHLRPYSRCDTSRRHRL